VTRRQTLDEIERRPDGPATRPRRVTAKQIAESRLPVLACDGCWCGRPVGHDWPGKTQRAPHPRCYPGRCSASSSARIASRSDQS
jgi:hypothetical protein